MKTSLKSFAAALAFAAALPAAAQNFVDTGQPMLDPTLGAWFGAGLPFWVYAPTRLAQTATVQVGGTLQGVFLPISDCSNFGGDVVVEVVDVVAGLPGTKTLDRVRVPGAVFDAGGHFVYVPFANAAALVPGQQVALVIEHRTGWCTISPTAPGATYAGGQGFGDYPGWGWSPFPTPGFGDDLPFLLVLQ